MKRIAERLAYAVVALLPLLFAGLDLAWDYIVPGLAFATALALLHAASELKR